MQEMTSAALMAKRDALELDAAAVLGKMLFEFSRLDMNLGLCLVWTDGGKNMEQLTKTVEEMAMNSKLEELAKQVDAKLPKGSNRHTAYIKWLERAHGARQHRNALVHGRWGVEAHRGKVINVLGLPTSQKQRSIEYTIAELAAINDELLLLQVELNRLRDKWPL